MYVKGSNEQDQLVTCSNEIELAKFKSNMENDIEMSYLLNYTYFLGIEFINTKYRFFAPEEICKRHIEEIQDEIMQPCDYSRGNRYKFKE